MIVSKAETANDVAAWSGLSGGLDGISLVICDLWGVVHDGIELIDSAVAALQALYDSGLPHVLLTNAPRPRSYVIEQLQSMGMSEHLYQNLITSGSLSRALVRNDYVGKRCYHLGPASDGNLLDGLPVEMVESPAEADIILASGLDFREAEAHRLYLMEPAARRVPFICANPDRVVHVGDDLWLCPGLVADIYRKLGGPVIDTGKPAPAVLQACVNLLDLRCVKSHEVLMIGDGLMTDVLGANQFGARSLLITGGIHRAEFQTKADVGSCVSRDQFITMSQQNTAIPSAFMAKLKW